MRFLRSCLTATLPLVAFMGPAMAADTPVAPGTAPEVTVYGGDLALVREKRTFRLPTPEARLAFAGVSQRLQPETAALQVAPMADLKATDVKILDQTFAFTVVSQQTLLEKSLGQEISIITTNPATGRDTTERAKVLAVQDGVVLDIGGKIHTSVPGRMVFDTLPPGLKSAPTLLVTAAGPTGKDIAAEFSYLTNGLGWRADYVANYDNDAGRLDLTAWATITNTTGVEFKDAKLKLSSGDFNRVVQQQPRPAMRMAKMEMMASAAAAPMADGVSSESMDGSHLYTVARPTTLSSGESKQVVLMRAVNLPVKRDLIVRGQPWFFTSSMAGQKQEGRVEIEMTVKNEAKGAPAKGKGKVEPGTDDTTGLGVPLPAGVVRAYGQDSDGAPQFLGEDRIDHVAEGAEVKLHLGRDVDLPVTREQTSFVRAGDNILLSVWRLTFRNAKSKATTVRLTEPVTGNWEITKESLPHTKSAGGGPEWAVTIPPKGETILEYSVKIPNPNAPAPQPAIPPTAPTIQR